MDLSFSTLGTFYWDYGLFAIVLGGLGVYWGIRARNKTLHLMRQLEREKKRSDQLANFVIPIGLSLAAETDLNTLLEKILLEGRALSHADGGTLYLVTPEKTLRFGMLINDSLKMVMGGTSGQPVSLVPLNLHDPVTGEPNLKNIATS